MLINITAPRLVLSFILGALLLLLSDAASAMMIKPMRVELSARPGDTVTIPIEVSGGGGDLEILVATHDLYQNPTGGWITIDRQSDFDTSRLSSAHPWLTVDKSPIVLKTSEPKTIPLSLTIPRNAGGHYFAAVSFTTDAPSQSKNIALKFRMLVPIIVEVVGKPLRQNLQIADLKLGRGEKDKEKVQNDFIEVEIENQGRTYSQLAGSVSLKVKGARGLVQVTKAQIKPVSVIPGVTLTMPLDAGRKLPGGTYVLTANATVDGRRIKPIEREVVFEGDSTVQKLQLDTSLTVLPSELRQKLVPKAMRTTTVVLQNGSSEEITVEAATVMPESLKGMMIENMRGDELSCHPWVKVSPPKFTLAPGGKQSVQVVASMPETADRANYYGKLLFRATFEGGAPAGSSESFIVVANSLVKPDPKVQILKLNLSAAEEPGRYIVTTKAVNYGNVEFNPKARARLSNTTGQSIVDASLSGDEGLMLPMMFRDFSGEIDLSKVTPGNYLLSLFFDYGDKAPMVTRTGVKVTKDGVTLEEGGEEEANAQ